MYRFQQICLGLLACCLLLLWVGMPLPAAAVTMETQAMEAQMMNEQVAGDRIFQVQCAGCHINGGNIVRRGKTLKQTALQKNGVDTLAAIAALVRNGKGNMSAYGERLTAEEIEQVSAYVLARAAQNWQ